MLNRIIRKANGNESIGEVISMILLSARATIYLRNNNSGKFEMLEKEINDVIIKCKKYSSNFKMTA